MVDTDAVISAVIKSFNHKLCTVKYVRLIVNGELEKSGQGYFRMAKKDSVKL
jgi:hypothetical protein